MYFLDTNTCIYFLKGIYKSIKEHFKEYQPKEIKIPSIVKAELLLGIEKSRQKKNNKIIYEKFLEPFEVISFDDKAAIQYAIIRARLEKAGTIIGPNDLIIASIVLSHNGILVTHNVSEFKRIPGLLIEDWTI